MDFQVECALKYELIFDCYTPKEEEKLRENFLLDQLEEVVNSTQLSDEFINQCSTLKLFKFQYLFENFGFTNCTLNEIFDAFRHKKMCEQQLETKIKFLMGFGATS